MARSLAFRTTGAVPRPRWLYRVLCRVWPVSGEVTLICLLTAAGFIAHGLNMFNFPSFTFKDDEGIYTAQAWAVLREGRLAPYTYWYDHAPAGWILIAAWMGLTGGPHAFGGAIDSGRVLMLILHVAMVPLLYRVARKLGCPPAAAALTVLLFSHSPLAIFYQRLVLLDNIMLFWVLLSLDLLLDGWGRLSRVALSGLCWGLSHLTKETAVFYIPAMLFIAYHQRWRHQGRFALYGWLLPMVAVTSWYPLYADLKNELLPAGLSFTFFIFNLGGHTGSGVSLIEALQWQAARGGGGMFNLGNMFWQLVRTEWLPRDALLLIGGTVAIGLNLLRGLRDRRAMAAGLLGLLPLYYLARGGVVFDYYLLCLIPFLCLNLGLLAVPLLGRIPLGAAPAVVTVGAAALLWGYWTTGTLEPLYRLRSAEAGRQAIAWIKGHLPPQSLIISRDDLWTDLREPGLGGPGFPGVHSHWKVAADPEVRLGVFKDDWRTVDYLIMSPGLDSAFAATGDEVALQALRNAQPVRRWEVDGSVVEVWKVNQPGATEDRLLTAGATYIAGRFARDGAHVRPDGSVASESQAYAMLRAVWLDDRESFDRVWGWTRRHLLNDKGLLAWLWRDGAVVDKHAAADADTDAALALLFAGRRWGDPELVEAGRRMVRAIWEHEVATVRGRPYVTAGDWATAGPVVAINPSYFAPYAYRVFAAVDPEHDWRGVLDAGYDLLFQLASATLGAPGTTGLPPDWVGLDRTSGALVPLQLDKGVTTGYGFDAPRTYWRVALDQIWTDDGRARAYLSQAGFLRDEVQRKGEVSAVYARDGAILDGSTSMVGQAGALAALLTLDPRAAHAMYARHIVGGVIYTDQRPGRPAFWADPDNLYAQEWAWFATALYARALPDLWHTAPAAAAPPVQPTSRPANVTG